MKPERLARADWRVGVGFAVTALLFLPTLTSYPTVWRAQPYTNGFLIALAGIWLVWRERAALRAVVPMSPMWLPAAGLSLLWMLAVIADIRVIAQSTLPLLLLLLTAAVFGRTAAVRLAPVAAIFLLAVPLWSILAPPLRIMTVATTRATLASVGIPAEFQGDDVLLEYGGFRIEDGCAGLNYLLSGLTIGAIYALVLLRDWRSRAAVLALSALLPILGNWVRVASLVVLGHTTRMESIFVTDSDAHLWYGWGIFLLTLLVFFPLASRVERRSRAKRRAPSGPPVEDAVAAVGEAAPAGGAAMRWALVAFAAAGLGPIAYYAIGALPARTTDTRPIEAATEAWTRAAPAAARPFQWRPSFTGADEQDEAVWTNGDAVVVADRFAYREQSQGAELIGYDSRIAPDSLLVMTGLVGPLRSTPRLVNEAVVRSPDGPLLVWYWYRVGGLETESAMRAKMLEIWAFLSRRTSAELLAVSAPCQPDSCAEAARSLLDFLGST